MLDEVNELPNLCWLIKTTVRPFRLLADESISCGRCRNTDPVTREMESIYFHTPHTPPYSSFLNCILPKAFSQIDYDKFHMVVRWLNNNNNNSNENIGLIREDSVECPGK